MDRQRDTVKVIVYFFVILLTCQKKECMRERHKSSFVPSLFGRWYRWCVLVDVFILFPSYYQPEGRVAVFPGKGPPVSSRWTPGTCSVPGLSLPTFWRQLGVRRWSQIETYSEQSSAASAAVERTADCWGWVNSFMDWHLITMNLAFIAVLSLGEYMGCLLFYLHGKCEM